MKYQLTILLGFLSFCVHGQQKFVFEAPAASPEASFSQQLNIGEISITYSRPLARGRKIFGGLVPFDSMWRTGAGSASILRLSEDVLLAGNIIAVGKYSIFTIPGKEEWTIIINSDTALHGTEGYDIKKDLKRFKVRSLKAERFTEAFTIDLTELTASGSGLLNLSWENTTVPIPIQTVIDDRNMSDIRSKLIDTKSDDPELLYQAANYYYSTRRDLKLAAEWISKAETIDVNKFEYPNLLQKILGDLKEYKAAIAAANRAIVLGEKKQLNTAVGNLRKRILEWQNKE